MKPLFQLFVTAAMLATIAGCTSPAQQRAASALMSNDPFAGKWEGRWTSAKHANSGGKLQCVLTPVSLGGGLAKRSSRYNAHFKAYWLTFSKSYDVPLVARRRGNEIAFHGTHELPAIYGGKYVFDGRATPEHFLSDYTSSYDHGKFEMHRPASGL